MCVFKDMQCIMNYNGYLAFIPSFYFDTHPSIFIYDCDINIRFV